MRGRVGRAGPASVFVVPLAGRDSFGHRGCWEVKVREQLEHKIEKLTSEQEAKFDEYRDKWLKIGLATVCDRKAAEIAIDDVYRCADLVPPKIKIWLKSPLEGTIGSYLLHQVRDQVWEQVWEQVKAQVRDQVGEQVGEQVWDQVGEQVWDQVKAQVGDQVKDQVGEQVWDQVRAQVWDQVREQMYNSGYGTHDAAWLAFYTFFSTELNIECCKKLNGLTQLAQSGCGWWWPFENAVILTEPPKNLYQDDLHRLHHETGPALEYQDGFSLYCWHGVRVTKEIIEHPEDIKPEQVLKESNQEVRRVMLERYGWDNLLKDLMAVEVHHDKYGVLYETSRLKEYLEGEDNIARFVHVKDPSTAREYTLRVPPTIATAHDAVAWTFGFEGKEAVLYAPEKET